MARDLVLQVIEESRGDALGKVARDADRAGDSLGKLGGEMRKAGKDADDLDVHLGRIGKRAGRDASKGALSSLGDFGGSLRGALIPVAIGAVAALSPMIGGMIAGAVVGGVGLGGIAGGIAMASQDNAVRQSARLFKQDIAEEFFGGGQVFVAPIIESLGTLRNSFRDLDLGGALAPLAEVMPDLARGIAGFAESAMPGLERAFIAAGPAIEVFAEMLPAVGSALGEMLATISESEGALTGLRTLMFAISSTFLIVGNTIDFLATQWHRFLGLAQQGTGMLEDFGLFSETFREMNDTLAMLTGTSEKVVGAWAPIPGRFHDMGAAAADASVSTQGLTMSIDELRNTLDEAFSDQFDYDQALLKIKKDTFDLKQAVDDHGTSLSNNTEAGLDNQEMILGLIGDYERQRDAAIKAGKGTAEATRKFDDQVAALEIMLIKLGFNRKQIDELLGAYKRLHAAPTIQKEIRFNVSVSGQTGALAAMGNVGRIPAFADGGPVPGPRGKPRLIVAHGGEFVLSEKMLSGAAAGPAASGTGGGGRMEWVVNTAGAPLDDLLGDLIRRYVDVRGGDAQAALSTR